MPLCKELAELYDNRIIMALMAFFFSSFESIYLITSLCISHDKYIPFSRVDVTVRELLSHISVAASTNACYIQPLIYKMIVSDQDSNFPNMRTIT